MADRLEDMPKQLFKKQFLNLLKKQKAGIPLRGGGLKINRWGPLIWHLRKQGKSAYHHVHQLQHEDKTIYSILGATGILDQWQISGGGWRRQSPPNNFRLSKCDGRFISSSSQEAIKNSIQVSVLV